MSLLRLVPLALAALVLAAPAGHAADAPGERAAAEPLVPVQAVPGTAVLPARETAAVVAMPVTGQPATVIYVYPTSPSTFVPVLGLPSFVIQPGAPLPEVSMQVVHAVPLPAFAMGTLSPAGDLDCSNFEGTVHVVPPDVHNLDRDGDGLGCEPGDR